MPSLRVCEECGGGGNQGFLGAFWSAFPFFQVSGRKPIGLFTSYPMAFFIYVCSGHLPGAPSFPPGSAPARAAGLAGRPPQAQHSVAQWNIYVSSPPSSSPGGCSDYIPVCPHLADVPFPFPIAQDQKHPGAINCSTALLQPKNRPLPVAEQSTTAGSPRPHGRKIKGLGLRHTYRSVRYSTTGMLLTLSGQNEGLCTIPVWRYSYGLLLHISCGGSATAFIQYSIVPV